MQTKTWAALAAGVVVVAAGAVAVAVASDWGGERKKGRHGHGRGHSLHLIQYDADKDGRITRGEIDAGLAAQFQGADSNGDGKLDAAEFQKYNDARKAERKARIEAWRAKREAQGGDPKERPPSDRGPRHFDPMKSMDWNLDGAITQDEFGGKTRSQAMRADRDGDGTILVEDLKKKRGKWRRGKDRRGGEETPAQP
jgi:uncharacterized protein (DUF2141 family)